MAKNTPNESPGRASILSVFQHGLYRELLQDLQEYLFIRFKRPSLILIPQQDKSSYSCFPRKREPLPNEFFHHLLNFVSKSRIRFPVELEERKHAELCLRAGSQHKVRSWGWHTSDLGLVDFYHPLSIPLPNINLGVLVFGKYRDASQLDLTNLHRWIDQIVAFVATESFLDRAALRETALTLHQLAEGLPVISLEQREEIQTELISAISLTQVFLKSTFDVSSLLRGDNLIDSLGLGQPNINISEDQLWLKVLQALERIVKTLNLTSAVLYAAKHRDSTEMRLVAKVPSTIDVRPIFRFPSKAEFDWLQGESWANIPSASQELSWVKPEKLLGAERGILFAGEMIGGNLILLGFGQGMLPIAPHGRVALYDAVNSRIFRFIDNAFFGIELDHLMAETGHLMGRAVGKVSLGAQVLQKIKEKWKTRLSATDEPLFRKAIWAIEDGEANLELIRQNFYAFQSRRRKGESSSHQSGDTAVIDTHEFEVAAVVREMKGYFDRAVAEAEKQTIKYVLTDGHTRVRGNRNALRLTLLNLFDNALKFSYAKTFLTITVTSSGSTCVISFTNLGIGVAKDETKVIFQAFTKSRFKDIVRHTEGLGLGLSYCRWVVEDIFGGSIQLSSAEAKARTRKFEGDNWLTTVTITLPLIEQHS